MTLQQVFDKIWKRFIVERKPFGMNPKTEKCVYYGNNGRLKCAIGCCLPPSVAQKINNGITIYGLISEEAEETFNKEVYKIFSGIELSALTKLQSIHDKLATDLVACKIGTANGTRESFKQELINFAKLHNLEIKTA